jgi:hypothetical protein
MILRCCEKTKWKGPQQMRKNLVLIALFAGFATLSMAESFSGRLVDATCYDQQKTAIACDPTSTSTAYALVVSGKALKLDQAGNAKAAEAIKNRADRVADPNKPANNQLMAKITGTQNGEALKVDSIEVQ